MTVLFKKSMTIGLLLSRVISILKWYIVLLDS